MPHPPWTVLSPPPWPFRARCSSALSRLRLLRARLSRRKSALLPEDCNLWGPMMRLSCFGGSTRFTLEDEIPRHSRLRRTPHFLCPL